jgi:hypothetical protein
MFDMNWSFETLIWFSEQMVSANMPELMQHEDIYYLRDKFFLDETEEKAVEELLREMSKSVKGTYRIVDNFFHNLKHGQG